MPNPSRFTLLKRRCRELQRHLIPAPSPTGAYSARQLDLTRAYRLLVHAEFEAFLEDRVKDVFLAAQAKWNKSRASSRSLAALLAYAQDGRSVPEALAGAAQTDFQRRVQEVLSQHLHKVRNNNGVKRKNVLALLLPAGVDEATLDNTWLNAMEAFGSARGHVAHSSSLVAHAIDPQTEVANVATLLKGLEPINDMLDDLLLR